MVIRHTVGLGQEHRASLGNGCDSVDEAAALPLEVIIPYSAKGPKTAIIVNSLLSMTLGG